MRFKRDRFDQALLDELLATCAGSVAIDQDEVTIKHCYTERRMTPLNLWLNDAAIEDWEPVLDDYGWAIKQMAAANIFAGDMLLKNFGVTRHGRVVFYDYDEIVYLTEVNFRKVPIPMTPEQEMAAEPGIQSVLMMSSPKSFRPFCLRIPSPGPSFRSCIRDL